MHPILLDLSKWKPFGLDLGQLAAVHRDLLIVLAVVGLVAAFWGTWARKKHKALLAVAIAGWLAFGLCVGILAAAMGRINSYGLMMALGFMVGIHLARRRARRCGENGDEVTTLGILALLGGVVGARASYVFEHWADGWSLKEAAAITSGGLVFDGGLILAVIVVLGYLTLRRLPVRRYLDIITVSCMVGLAFGRVGCLLNGCCFGGLARQDCPVAIEYPYSAVPLVYPHEGLNPFPEGASPSPVYAQQFRQGQLKDVPPELIGSSDAGQHLKMPHDLQTAEEIEAARRAHAQPVQPAQVYAIINNLVLAGLLTLFFRLRTREGQVFAMMFVLYAIARIVLEVIRDDNPSLAITPAQWKSAVLFLAGVALLIGLRFLPASAGPTWAQRAELAAANATGGRRPDRSRSNRAGKSGGKR